MLNGLLDFSLTGHLIALLILTQITIAAVTIYLHRCQTHQALNLHPIISHFFRFWLWMTTGIKTKEWVAIHRKHHAKCETVDDPHSPKIFGLKTLLLQGAEVYRAGKTPETLEHYGHGTPDDWLERRIYSAHDRMGIALMLIINLCLFGLPGISMWAVQMIWIPLSAGGIINGIGHFYGYRNFEPKDASTNLLPLAIFIGGEELHNNHHAFPSSAKLSANWWEVDIGWFYIKILAYLGLATIKRSMPKLSQRGCKTQIDLDTVKIIINHRLQIMADYTQQVIAPVLLKERKKITDLRWAVLHDAEKLLTKAECLLDETVKQRALLLLKDHPILSCVYQFKITLQKIWEQTTASQQELLEAVGQWRNNALQTDNLFLKDFAKRLSHYST